MNKLYKLISLLLVSMLSYGTVSAQAISKKEILEITIKGVPATEQTRIAGRYVVSPEGFIFLPLIKNGIQASGKSSSSLARNIEAAYRGAEMYENPRITVLSTKDNASVNIDAQLISIGGFVKAPGQRPYTRGMTLFQAVAAAGGESAFGSIRRVELHRNGKKWTYDLRNAQHMRVKIYPQDTINVPQKKWDGS